MCIWKHICVELQIAMKFFALSFNNIIKFRDTIMYTVIQKEKLVA